MSTLKISIDGGPLRTFDERSASPGAPYVPPVIVPVGPVVPVVTQPVAFGSSLCPPVRDRLVPVDPIAPAVITFGEANVNWRYHTMNLDDAHPGLDTAGPLLIRVTTTDRGIVDFETSTAMFGASSSPFRWAISRVGCSYDEANGYTKCGPGAGAGRGQMPGSTLGSLLRCSLNSNDAEWNLTPGDWYLFLQTLGPRSGNNNKMLTVNRAL